VVSFVWALPLLLLAETFKEFPIRQKPASFKS
jgi:hypothetical protein